jgi:hypothetical protein
VGDSLNRKSKGSREDLPKAGGGSSPTGRVEAVAARLNAVLRSHAELRSALRAAGRWMMRRAVNNRDFGVVDKLRDILQRAEALSGLRPRGTTRSSSANAFGAYPDQRKRKRMAVSSLDGRARVLVMPNELIPKNRRASRRALQQRRSPAS